MDSKKYPMVMHQVLGVEPNEVFRRKGWVDTEYRVTLSGRLEYRATNTNCDWSEMASQKQLEEMINYGIVKHPLITPDQLQLLKNVYDLMGAKYAYIRGGNVFLTDLTPERDESELLAANHLAWNFLMPDKSESVLLPIFESRIEVLDIVKALKDSGIDVDC